MAASVAIFSGTGMLNVADPVRGPNTAIVPASTGLLPGTDTRTSNVRPRSALLKSSVTWVTLGAYWGWTVEANRRARSLPRLLPR